MASYNGHIHSEVNILLDKFLRTYTASVHVVKVIQLNNSHVLTEEFVKGFLLKIHSFKNN